MFMARNLHSFPWTYYQNNTQITLDAQNAYRTVRKKYNATVFWLYTSINFFRWDLSYLVMNNPDHVGRVVNSNKLF